MENLGVLKLQLLNIVPRLVGLSVQELLINVLTVKRMLLQLKVLINHTVTKNVGMSITKLDLKDIIVTYGKAVKQKLINYLGLLQSLENGVKKYLSVIIISVYYVVRDAVRGIGLKFTQIILSHYQNILNLPMIYQMVGLYVDRVTWQPLLGAISGDPKYTDVIRKRYTNLAEKVQTNG